MLYRYSKTPFLLVFAIAMAACSKKSDVSPKQTTPPAEVVMGLYNAYVEDVSNPTQIHGTGSVSVRYDTDNNVKMYFTAISFYYYSPFNVTTTWDNSIDGKINFVIPVQCDDLNCIKGEGFYANNSISLTYSLSGNGDTTKTSFPFTEYVIGSK